MSKGWRITRAGMQIRPVKSQQDHRAAIARIEQLMGAAAGSPEAEELDVLATLVDAYEAKHHLIDPPDPIAAIRFRMEQQNLSRKDLEAYIGSRARVSEVLANKRPLTLRMIRRINVGLGISADLLIREMPQRNRVRARHAQAGRKVARSQRARQAIAAEA
jgi:HTH-type transcriptional regulator / antitoxin HigA